VGGTEKRRERARKKPGLEGPARRVVERDVQGNGNRLRESIRLRTQNQGLRNSWKDGGGRKESGGRSGRLFGRSRPGKWFPYNQGGGAGDKKGQPSLFCGGGGEPRKEDLKEEGKGSILSPGSPEW